MSFRKISAGKIFDGYKFKEDHVLIIKPDGTIENLLPKGQAGEDVEQVEGTLVPGFINSHCHVELSHLKNTVAPGKGLIGFLMEVVQNRKTFNEGKEEAIVEAMNEMYRKGISGVADICNTTDALLSKLSSVIQWHSFVEVLNFSDDTLEQRFTHFQNVRQAHIDAGLIAELCGHAPYSVTEATWRRINDHTAGAIVSVHNQETAAENDLFLTGGGDFDQFYQQFNNRLSPFPATGSRSLPTWLSHFTNGQTIFLVHDLFINEEDILFAREHAAKYDLNLVYCLCPNANIYIEDRLPPVDLLIKHECHIVIGTDSYGSNHELSIASELKTLHQHFPHLPLEILLMWATRNGAQALQWNQLGTFEKGKKPGVVLLHEDFTSVRLA